MQSENKELSQWYLENVQPHESMLTAWLRSKFSSNCDVENIVQESVTRVVNARNNSKIRSPKAFLFATARNLALDSLRHSSVSKTQYLEQNDLMEYVDDSVDIPEEVARNQELEILTQAIQSLPDRCRQIFTLRKVYGMSQKEIGKMMQISEHTVSAQLTIGLKRCSAFIRNAI